MDEYLVGLAVALGFLFGWNNGSFLFGNLKGSGIASFRTILAIAAVGLFLGVLLEGPKMYSGMTGSLTPVTTNGVLLATLAVSVVFTLALTLLSLPVSFSMVMVASFLGASMASGIPVNFTRSLGVVSFWFAAPLASALLTFVLYTWTKIFISRYGILVVDALNRGGSALSALLVSYTLGANNIGLIYGSTGTAPANSPDLLILVAITVAAVAGTALSARTSVSGTVGDKMLSLSPQGVFTAFAASSAVVWLGTQFAVPLSISQCLLGGMFGAAYTKNVAVLNRRLAAETLSVWLVAPLLGFAAGYLLIPVVG